MIVTVPLHAVHRIAFTPELPVAVTRATESGQLGLGTKVWFTIEGEHPPFVALGADDWPLNFFQSEYVKGGRTFVIGFGPDATAVDVSDTAAIQATLNRLMPHARVIDSTGHDWVADEFAQETWPMHRIGFLSGSLRQLQEPIGGVRFAGSDVADGWGGFIDGAIDSGMKAARAILRTPAARAVVAV